MTKTVKKLIRYHLKRAYFNGSTDTVARQNGVIPNDTKLGETQIDVELNQALKELEAIILEQVIGSSWTTPMTHEQFSHQFLVNKKIEADLRAMQREALKTALYGGG